MNTQSQEVPCLDNPLRHSNVEALFMSKSPQMGFLDRMLSAVTNGHRVHYGIDGLPEIFTCIGVANKVASQYGNSDLELLAIAVGHSLFKDTHITAVDLIRDYKMSQRVVAGIKALTPAKHPGFTERNLMVQIGANIDALRVRVAVLEFQADLFNRNSLEYTDYCEVVETRQLLDMYRGLLSTALSSTAC